MSDCNCGMLATQKATFKTELLEDRGSVYQRGDTWNKTTLFVCDDCSTSMFIQANMFKPVPQQGIGDI